MFDKASSVYYIDNLRVLLTCLVVLHHLATTYAPPADWYFEDPQTNGLATLVLLTFVASNQAFFMGFFFLIAAYFTPDSLARKGLGHFLWDRFLRLLIPLLFYTLVLHPVIVAIVRMHVKGFEGSYVELFFQSYGDMLGVGPMWFVQYLLLLTLALVLIRRIHPMEVHVGPVAGPSFIATITLALSLGVISFLVRIRYPIGYWKPGLNLMPAYAPQYLGLFVIGILARERGWRGDLSPRLVRFWCWVVPLATVGAWASLVASQPENLFSIRGGFHWESFVYAMWDQTYAVGIILLLTNWFSKRFNHQGSCLRAAAADSYTVYIIHPLVVVILTLCIRGIALHPLAKFALLAPVALAACFGSAHLVRLLPFARRIL
jgi:surface polysaccharide O-acyltransferase-like enzyme